MGNPMKYITREQKVQEFMDAMDQQVNAEPTKELISLRTRLIMEEAVEVSQSLGHIYQKIDFGQDVTTEDWAHVLKECTDLQYVLSGLLVALAPLYNVDFDVAYNRTHKSNLSKLDDDGNPVKNEHGKVIKGDNYLPPHLEDLIDNGSL